MATKSKTVSVSKRPSAEQIVDARRWQACIKASGLAFENVTDDWWNFFEAQSDPASASTELVRLIDIAIERDEKK